MNHDLIYFPKNFHGQSEKIRIAKGNKVVTSGSYPHYVYVVLSGIANVIYVSGKGKDVEASQFLEGDYIGELNAVCSQPFLFDAIAITDMTLLKIPAADFIREMKSDFRMVQSMMQSQNNRINYLEAYYVVNSTFSLYERVLLYLCCRFSFEEEAKSLSKNLLVATMGTDLRNMNKVLLTMRENHLIEVKKGQITVLDYNAMIEEAKERNIYSQIALFYEYIVDRDPPFRL